MLPVTPPLRRVRSAHLRRHAAPPRYAQGFITTFNLPKTLNQLLDWVGPEPKDAGTQLDNLRDPELRKPFTWTAPAGVGRGDVVFFHYAAKALGRVGALRRAALEAGVLTPGLGDFFEYARAQAHEDAGRIVAVGELTGPAVPEAPEPGDVTPHWDSRLYAPVSRLHVLKRPLELRVHEGVLPRPHKTITELTAGQFGSLADLVVERESARPLALLNVLPGRDGFEGFSADAWRAVACRADQRFAHETELCGYLVEPLLDEIKDPGTQIYKEARCIPHGAPRRTTSESSRRGALPRADYVVQLRGRWTPVEVKRRLENWPGLLGQVARYVGVAAYGVRTREGERLRLPAAPDGAACLLVDQAGLYAARGGTYHASAPGRPLLTREALAGVGPAHLRRRVCTAVC